jgi:hypothetical protein
MTALYQDRSGGPRTHALILGIGEYRHLSGHPTGPRLANPMELEQLTSPPHSARRMADWLIEELHNPDAPLGSIEMLVSPAMPYDLPAGARSPLANGGASVPVEAATMANIKGAFNRWVDRCDEREGNVAIFFFSGHGLARDTQVLLAEDFGAEPRRPFENSLDFDMMHLGMAEIRARTQCFFVDACRNVPRELLAKDIEGWKPFGGRDVRVPGGRDAPIIWAAVHNDSAYGLAGSPTYFTEALIRALDGLAADKQGCRPWTIRTSRIGEAVKRLVDRMDEKGRLRQRCEPDGPTLGHIIHVLKKGQRPAVPIRLGCDPNEATSHASFRLRSPRAPGPEYERGPRPGAWEVTLPADVYQFEAVFSSGIYEDVVDEQFWVHPPEIDQMVPVNKTVRTHS